MVAKFPIKAFGPKSDKFKSLYPEAKLLVFCTEPWKLTGTHGVAINEGLTYALGKFGEEYLIMAEKRIAEFVMRTKKEFKTLIIFPGD